MHSWRISGFERRRRCGQFGGTGLRRTTVRRVRSLNTEPGRSHFKLGDLKLPITMRQVIHPRVQRRVVLSTRSSSTLEHTRRQWRITTTAMRRFTGVMRG